MYFSAERLALANQAVCETFEQCSVAWQTIPHWDTGDPSKTQVPNDNLAAPAFLTLTPTPEPFLVTLAEALAPSPDYVMEAVIAATVKLAADVDNAVFPGLWAAGPPTQTVLGTTAPLLLNTLIGARATVEKAGYRAPSCLITDTVGVETLAGSTIANGFAGTDVLLPPANINSFYRVDTLSTALNVRGYLLGRRQRMAPGGAMEASPGEEAVDLAVSVPPSLEVIGEAAPNVIGLRVRITYALRVKDIGGLVAFVT
jgi:hypothetical protein